MLDILATTHLTMGSLPDAGALWFVTGRSDALAEEAVAAWRERYGSEEARWYSIPAPIRRGERLGDLRALRQAEPSKTAGRRDLPPPDRARWGAYVAGAGCLLVVLWIAVAVVVGSIALVRAILG